MKCLSVRIYKTALTLSLVFVIRVATSFMLSVAVGRSSSAIRYAFPVLWMTLYLPTIGQAVATQVERLFKVTRN